jgi:hypothetical protein
MRGGVGSGEWGIEENEEMQKQLPIVYLQEQNRWMRITQSTDLILYQSSLTQ